EVRVVEASAGSGKTYALAKRYVQLILNPALTPKQIPIRQVLAITFTNKAAFEMKARILEFLKRIALKQLSKAEQADILTPVGLNGAQASLKAFEAMGTIIRHYNFFQVQTIDKFINAILSGCAFKIKLTANFKIKTNPKEYLERSLDHLIDRAHGDQEVLQTFERFLHHYLYLENRSGWFPKDDILAIITTLFEKYNTYGTMFKASRFKPEDIVKKKASLLEELRSLRRVLPQEVHAGFIKSLDKFLANHTKGFDIDSISDYFAREEVPVKKGAVVSRDVDQLWSKIHKNIKKLCEEEAYSLFNPYVDVFGQVIDGFYALASKDDCLFLNELNKRAGSLFDEGHVTVEELYYRLATRFHHYLIDEFQDTSRLQWRNLEKMAEEALSTGGTLFAVGDRKQAIYGFRGGDVGLFDDIKRTFGAFNVVTDLLLNNWRSQKKIVEFNNTVFSADNLKRFIRQKESYEMEKDSKVWVPFTDEDIGEIGRMFESAQQVPQVKNDEGYVHIEYIDAEKKEERESLIREKLIALVRDLKKRFAYRDIAVLTRANKEVKEITDWLLKENIPVESERTSDITENSFIAELVAFFRFLDAPIDNLSFSAFILGDIFTRATGLGAEEMHRFVFKLRDRMVNEKGFYVYVEFRERYPDVWGSFMEGFFRNVGLYPLYELAVTMYSRFGILDHCREAQGFFMHFLELIKSQEEEHADIASFLDYFDDLQGEDLYVQVTDSDAVKVLTIHKSKGLEFPVVILPYLSMDVQIGASSGEYQPSYILQHNGDGMGLLRIKTKYLKYSEKLYGIYGREYKTAFLSELNNLYVAMTRPKHELYGYIPKRSGNSFNDTKFLIPENLYIQGRQQLYEPTVAKDVSMRAIPPSDFPDWMDYLKDEFLDAGQFKYRKQRLKGEILHYILSLIGNLFEENQEHVVESALADAKRHFTQMDDWDEYKAQINALLSYDNLRKFFDCGQAEVFTEKEMVDMFGHTKRCDRLIVFKDEVWVVDYKSTEEPLDRYEDQVREYKDVIQHIYPRRTVKGFLIYLDGLNIKEV
ncbi:MAG: UvrD-helicase domain-containing protein, partial [Candidatus Omnitrophica bacterium]|nr:UvrD-helicase domain-containing protein [Candidatus Omnitrophota bacterium]